MSYVGHRCARCHRPAQQIWYTVPIQGIAPPSGRVVALCEKHKVVVSSKPNAVK